MSKYLDDENDERYETVGSKRALRRLLKEYGLDRSLVDDLIRIFRESGEREYLIHRAVLRPHGEFHGAGDSEARAYLSEIAKEMTKQHGISRREPVARLNDWFRGNARPPQHWIVGDDLLYHMNPEDWAELVYYGPEWTWQQRDLRKAGLPDGYRPQ